MSNLLTSSQTQTSTAPGYYTDYLSNLASQGQAAAANAKFVDATDLQNQAFNEVADASSAYQPTLTAAGSTLNRAADANSPLSAANQYLQSASGDVGAAASGLMSPYMSNVVNALAEAGQRNISQNLAPQATASTVGSGQFGSKRGAEVLGQTLSNANRDILNQQSQALQAGYSDALKTALGQKQLEGQLANTAGQLASAGQQNLTQAGKAQADLAKTNQDLALAGINAKATLGAQQQTIAQNKQNFPLTNLSTLAGLVRGYNIPTSTTTTMNMSPLSALAGMGAGAVGLFTKNASGTSPWDNIKLAWNSAFKPDPASEGATEITNTAGPGEEGYGWKYYSDGTSIGPDGKYYQDGKVIWSPDGVTDNTDNTDNTDTADHARGGLIRAAEGGEVGAWNTSFAPHMNMGGLPAGGMPQYDQSNTYVGYNDTDGNFVQR
jgi:hypothetical protein